MTLPEIKGLVSQEAVLKDAVGSVLPLLCFYSSGIFSESDKEEEACLPGSSRMVANGDKDASVLVVEPVRSEELVVVRPKVRRESSRSSRQSARGK